MNKFAKSSLTVDGNSVRVAMPFAKVDVEKRTVSGYATLDNIDSQGDVVLAEASREAFAKARGNLREMHGKIAVGRVIDFREDEFFDTNTGELYRGIYVTAYVSKGAPDTWEKVLDGTLSGFSIGGEVTDSDNQFVKEAGRTVRFIKGYDLVELSLVDNPANQLANVDSVEKSIFSFTKVADGSVNVEGMVADTTIESVFFCKNDDTIVVKAAEDTPCPVCETKMDNIGWFESGSDRSEKVREIVTKFLSPTETEAAPTSEGGVEMAKKESEHPAPEAPVAAPDSPQVPPAAEPADPDAEETAEVDEVDEEEETGEVDEVEDEESAITKKLDELKDTVHDALEKTRTETKEKVESIEEKVEAIAKSIESQTSEWEKRFSEFGEKLETAKGRLAEFEKALEVVNSSGAVKKSADVESVEPVQKSKTVKWGTGTFSGESLFR